MSKVIFERTATTAIVSSAKDRHRSRELIEKPRKNLRNFILSKHQRLVAENKQRFAADPFIIAVAKLQRLTIVTEERPTGSMNRPSIPDVCSDYGLTYMNLLQLIRAEAWVI